MKKYPKVLIMFETFNSRSGGGITLSNLFKDWDKAALANALTVYRLGNIENTEHCNNYYYLGKAEFKMRFPFSLYFKVGESGKIDFSKKNMNASAENNSLKIRIINGLKPIISWIINFFNLIHFIYTVEISTDFLKWLKEFDPDYIYIQPSSLADMMFFKQLHKVSGVPFVMHMMDDWLNSKSKALFDKYWKRKIDKEFRELLEITNVFLSISEGMSEEYYRRYGKIFVPFHNTIEVDKWLPYTKEKFQINKEIKILYAGRIGLGIYNSFRDLIDVIEKLNKESFKISINIQTSFAKQKFRKELINHKCVTFNPFVDYSELPKVFSSYDLLVLPIDFEVEGLSFLKFSMPTKVSEFMISGTPILLYCPKQAYLHQHAEKYNWAYIINDNNDQKIKDGIIELITNEQMRISLSKTAVSFAITNFNSELVREKFRLQFSEN